MSVGVALSGGADYHMSSVVVLLILQLYVVFGFPSLRTDLAANACPTSDITAQLAASQFDLGMVLLLLLATLAGRRGLARPSHSPLPHSPLLGVAGYHRQSIHR